MATKTKQSTKKTPAKKAAAKKTTPKAKAVKKVPAKKPAVAKTAKSKPVAKKASAPAKTKAAKPVAAKKAAPKAVNAPKKAVAVKKTTKTAAVAKKTVKKSPAKAEKTVKTAKTPAVQATPVAAAKPAAPAKTAKKAAVAKPQSNVTPLAPVEQKPLKIEFAAGDFVVYPAHGVGQVESVDVQHIAGMEITLYSIAFEKDRMRVKIPVSKAKESGLRKLSSKDRLKDALATLQGRSQVRRIMWSRRAQEYETKINSGDPVSIAEVLRDLKKEESNSEQSYSERQIYQAALARLAREVAAIEEIEETKAIEKLESVLAKVA